MMRRLVPSLFCLWAMSPGLGLAQSPNGVATLEPPGAIKPEGIWSVGVRAGDFVFIAGMQGIDPATGKLVKEPEARIRQAFANVRLIAESQGASLQDCVRLTIYVSDLGRYAGQVDKVHKFRYGPVACSRSFPPAAPVGPAQ